MEDLVNKVQYNKLIEICRRIIERLSEPADVRAVVLADNNISMFGSHPWGDLVLSSGNLSISLLMTQWDNFYPEEGADLTAHKYFLETINALGRDGVPNNISMFSGLSGMGFALNYASHGGERYADFLEKINQLIFNIFDELIEAYREIKEVGVSPFWYDVISGLTGVGRYFLFLSDKKEARVRLEQILDYLISFADPVEVKGKIMPGWYIAPKNMFTNDDRKKYPNGGFNCGMAHGIAGPLSLLSLSASQGITVPGQREAIGVMADWLISKKRTEVKGLVWPSWVSLESEASGIVDVKFDCRDAWCYGTAGVSRSLYLAGKATDNKNYLDIARMGFEAVFNRDPDIWNLDGASFCHGFSGTLQVANRMYKDTGDILYKKLINKLLKEIINVGCEENPFIFKDFEGQNHIDKAGLLDGAAGIALSLVSTLHIQEDFEWDNCFLIS